GNGSGAIGLWTSSPVITNSLFEENSALLGGAIVCYMSSDASIQNNVFTNNSGIDYQGFWGTGYAGAIAVITNSHPDIINNIFEYNHADVGGGAILCIYYSNPLIKHNLIHNNTSDFVGGGIEIQDSSSPGCLPYIINNTIADNDAAEGGGIDIWGDGNPKITNTILWGNTASDLGNQVNIRTPGAAAEFYYCDIEDGEGGFGGHPPAVYEENIKSDPLFDNDYYLTSGSPCIDTGDSTMFDPDGTRCDIGAFFYDQTGIGISEVRYQNSEIRIECWPNPTNGKSEIRYQISRLRSASDGQAEVRSVVLIVYGIHGKEISVLVNETQAAGAYTVSFDASDLPAGLYIVRLQAGKESATGKIFVVR
ncbi:MAG: right-handed parallel beta-helix repeat-containing protein, partial [Bacteroidales bacterium]|nr:right-handed parallel beta-helix repeat-containing protein [Bacteroidales bacterium]